MRQPAPASPQDRKVAVNNKTSAFHRRPRVGTRLPDLVGEPYVDGSGVRYLPMFGHPVLVLPGGRRRAHTPPARQARGAGDRHAPTILFATDNDVDNRGAVAKVATADLALAGIAMADPAIDVDKAVARLRLHR